MADDSWVKTRTDRYLYAADKLNQSAKSFNRQPTASDYRQVLTYLEPATSEQLLVLNRLAEELRRTKLPWEIPGFALDSSTLVDHVARAQALARIWADRGSPEDQAPEVFKRLSNSFVNLIECNALLRKDLGWRWPIGDLPGEIGGPRGPHDGPPPVPSPAG